MMRMGALVRGRNRSVFRRSTGILQIVAIREQGNLTKV
jgi:hypothetical protein